MLCQLPFGAHTQGLCGARHLTWQVLWGGLYTLDWRYTYYVSAVFGLGSAAAYVAERLSLPNQSACWRASDVLTSRLRRYATAGLYGTIVIAATWVRKHTAQFLISREAQRTAAVRRLLDELEHVLTTRGYECEKEVGPSSADHSQPLCLPAFTPRQLARTPHSRGHLAFGDA